MKKLSAKALAKRKINVAAQFRALTSELSAVKDRVRHLIGDAHWLTDGEAKEAVLRSVLRRHLPRSIEPLTGFVLCSDAKSVVRPTKQIDVLLCDHGKPTLFRDGDLAFVTPDVVAGVIEVKANASNKVTVREHLHTLADVIEQIRDKNPEAIAAYFAFDAKPVWASDRSPRSLLDLLHEAAGGNERRAIDYVCIGETLFSLFWQEREVEDRSLEWEAFLFHDAVAPGYFMNNVIYSTSPTSVARNLLAWFPPHQKADVSRRVERRKL